ncbi:hypothetical protein [Nocardiopsis ganjiahuensis]|uniref:hypothetical protein n=1 Tax=Nocardiopsis ganjiahuensis TaxID=239984 RepID=UPI0003466E2C|nr:hypothetical protein [Nocardiopsis ganjiahuensis]
MVGYSVFPSHEIQQLRKEFPHHLICELHNHHGQPVFVATLLRRSCPCPPDLVTASTPTALREALASIR